MLYKAQTLSFRRSQRAEHVPNLTLFSQQTITTTIEESKTILNQIGEIASSLFNPESIITFIALVTAALLLGRIVAAFLRWLTKVISRQADKSEDLATVTRLRRTETMI